jgi:hypothetical protein
VVIAAGLLVLAAFAAYHNSFSGPFIYDDIAAIKCRGREAQTNFQILNYEQELQNLERVRHVATTLAMRARDVLFCRCPPRSWSCRCGARARASRAALPSTAE